MTGNVIFSGGQGVIFHTRDKLARYFDSAEMNDATLRNI